MIKFFLKLFKSILEILVTVLFCIYIFSRINNMSFKDTISHLQTVAVEIFSIYTSKDIPTSSNDTTIVTSCNNNFYYSQLNDTAKIIYNAFETNIDNLKKDNYVIDFNTTFNDLLNQTTGKHKLNKAFQSAIDAFTFDHPELFYIDSTKILLDTRSFSLGSLKTYKVKIIPKINTYLDDSFKSPEEVEIAIKKVEDIKNNIVNTVSKYTTYNKIKYVHDMLVNTIEYDANFNNNNIYNIYGALVEKKVVCEGYAKAFKYIMDALDIECILVTGSATTPSDETEAHMWNYVKLNDSWYGVDVTWDDPIIIGGPSTNNLRRIYLLKGYFTFAESHSPNGKITTSGMLFQLPTLSYENFK